MTMPGNIPAPKIRGNPYPRQAAMQGYSPRSSSSLTPSRHSPNGIRGTMRGKAHEIDTDAVARNNAIGQGERQKREGD
ncbi:MAG: hypothetical protein AVDCRST_MAG28-629 [uncultured Rubrobacteraceae bacterium]|uniref:Uncharacterized protein n=1 Tax=uncultured Rubrobacteraceae bacterium TaxID=349277 RepID=A0A6J4QKX6_9ACTN|nr:MAG: hypothetical protein AVDCRST_MAG28-629 [uncultured Rubrobacteraceae bacterium]